MLIENDRWFNFEENNKLINYLQNEIPYNVFS